MRWLEAGNSLVVAVLDYQLYGGGVIRLATLLASRNVPIIMCYGYRRPENLLGSLVGVPWVVKPVMRPELAMHVNTVATARRRCDQNKS